LISLTQGVDLSNVYGSRDSPNLAIEVYNLGFYDKSDGLIVFSFIQKNIRSNLLYENIFQFLFSKFKI